MTLDLFAGFRQFDTNKKPAVFNIKIAAENSAKIPFCLNLSVWFDYHFYQIFFCKYCLNSDEISKLSAFVTDTFW